MEIVWQLQIVLIVLTPALMTQLNLITLPLLLNNVFQVAPIPLRNATVLLFVKIVILIVIQGLQGIAFREGTKIHALNVQAVNLI